jgi:hypothetical protein
MIGANPNTSRGCEPQLEAGSATATATATGSTSSSDAASIGLTYQFEY